MKTKEDTLPFWRCWGAHEFPPRCPAPVQPPREPHPIFVAGRMLLALSLLTGVIYPLVVTVK